MVEDECVLHRDRAVAGESGPVLGARDDAEARRSRGRWTSIVNRVVRSTSVPIAERLQPDEQVAFRKGVAGPGGSGVAEVALRFGR